tara:strand:+ start:2455 stop:2676 length:222 start_codon:yes stop_codon:yes gene_type:complete
MLNSAQVKNETHEIGVILYAEVRASFIKQGTTFSAWCEKNHVWPASGRAALLGYWSGKKANALIKKIRTAANV